MPNIPLATSVRRNLGSRFREWVDAGLNAKGTGPSGWWREVTAFYENRLPETPGKNIVPWHVPLSQPRQDSLTANVCTVIAKQEPIMLCDLEDSEAAGRRQRFVHKVWTNAGIDPCLRKGSSHATNYNRCFYKITPKATSRLQATVADSGVFGMQMSPAATQCPGVDISVILPTEMTVFPALLGGCQEATLVGNRLYKTIGSCNRLITSGFYYKDATDLPEDNPENHDELGSKQHSGASIGLVVDHTNGGVELFDLVVTFDLSEIDSSAPKGYKRYRATLAFGNNELLALEPYPESYRYVWYFEGFYKPMSDSYWPETSIARDLKPLQDAYNKLSGTMYTYAQAAAKPLIFGPPPDTGEDFLQTEAFTYFASSEQMQPFSPTISFQAQPLVEEGQRIERVADVVARVSQNTMGSIQGRSTTATTDSIVAAGVAVGLEEWIGNFATPLPLMAEHTEDVMRGQYDAISKYYTMPGPVQPGLPNPDGTPGEPIPGEPVPLVTYDELMAPTVWRVNGMSPSATPQAKVQAATQLAAMMQDPATGLDAYEVAGTVLRNSPLSGVANLQLPKAEVHQMMASMQQGEQTPEPRINEIIDSKMAAMMTPNEFGQFLQKIGITPDQDRGQQLASQAQAGPGEGQGGGDGSGKSAGGSEGTGGTGGAGAHDEALLGAAHAPELQQIARALAKRGSAKGE